MNRGRLEEIIEEELLMAARLNEGFADLFKSDDPGNSGPPFRSGPYKGRPQFSLGYRERFRLGCYNIGIEDGLSDAEARKQCNIAPASATAPPETEQPTSTAPPEEPPPVTPSVSPEEPEELTPAEEEPPAEESSWTTHAADIAQLGLDVAGLMTLFPPTVPYGMAATIMSFMMNTYREKYGWALFDLFSLIPVVGGFAKAGKLGKAAKTASAAAKWKSGRQMIKTLGGVDKAKKFDAGLKGMSLAKRLEKIQDSTVELIEGIIPDELLEEFILAEVPEIFKVASPDNKEKYFVDFMLKTLKKIPMLEDKVPELESIWKTIKDNWKGRTGQLQQQVDEPPPPEHDDAFDYLREGNCIVSDYPEWQTTLIINEIIEEIKRKRLK